ncbi:NAAA amidase, partial [Amia calva]|nr:NAAA amidase [Amia calva]
MQGVSAGFELNLADVILLNLAYEISGSCTSIVAQDTNGKIYLARNMDYLFPEILKNITIDILYVTNGQVAYTATTYVGYVGILTGQSPGKFSISANERSSGFLWENAVSAIMLKGIPDSWLLRNTLDEAKDYKEAVQKLSNTPTIRNIYYTVAGVNPGEGVVVSRNRTGAVNMLHLNPLNGEWYIVQTNYDHWTTPLTSDFRRCAFTAFLWHLFL